MAAWGLVETELIRTLGPQGQVRLGASSWRQEIPALQQLLCLGQAQGLGRLARWAGSRSWPSLAQPSLQLQAQLHTTFVHFVQLFITKAFLSDGGHM